jgi:hypothetical protein
MMTVNDSDRVTCRLAIQMCVGYFPDGRERHRTFSIKNIDPNAEISRLSALVRCAIAPLLAYPITKVRLVTKKIRVLFDAGVDNAPAQVTETESRVVDLTGPEEPARPAEPANPTPESYPPLFLMSQNKRSVSYPTAWLMLHKISKAMADRDIGYKLSKIVNMKYLLKNSTRRMIPIIYYGCA